MLNGISGMVQYSYRDTFGIKYWGIPGRFRFLGPLNNDLAGVRRHKIPSDLLLSKPFPVKPWD